jgi:hypothetical protein
MGPSGTPGSPSPAVGEKSVFRLLRPLSRRSAGRFGVDFISVKEGDAWRHLAIEINRRKGGTTHRFLMLEFLTDGRHTGETGEFLA